NTEIEDWFDQFPAGALEGDSQFDVGDLSLVVRPSFAYTTSKLSHDGYDFRDYDTKNSFDDTLLFADADQHGSGHGGEVVNTTTLTLDGVVTEFNAGSVYTASSLARFRRQSEITGYM